MSPETDRPTSTNPLTGNPLRTREDVATAMSDLFEPLLPHFSDAGGRVRLGSFSAIYAQKVAELEGFARPLWGIVPFTQGGGRFPHWDLYRRGLAAGTDPRSPDYWGPLRRPGQRMVEMAAIGFAMAAVPEHIWEPLAPEEQERLVQWLAPINEHEPVRNNWQFFRVLVNLGFERVGAPVDRAAVKRSYDLIDSFHVGDGWSTDGADGHIDYYLPFAQHTYGLLHASLGLGDVSRSDAYRARAGAFAPAFRSWFDTGGAAVPFGRSLAYRCAQGSMWGALVAADEEALPWPEIKGLYLRHLRHWSTMDVADRDGVLTVGYAYDSRALSEEYNAPGSPYWAMKAFLALAAPEEHPFWQAEEAPMDPVSAVVPMSPARMVICRDGGHTVALSGGQPALAMFNQGAAKYTKLAYSSRFGFSADLPFLGRPPVNDSALVLTDDDGRRRGRTDVDDHEIVGDVVWSRWRPWPDVVIDSVLRGTATWHMRVHRIVTARPLEAEEAGFALGHDADADVLLSLVLGKDVDTGDLAAVQSPGRAEAWSPAGALAILDLDGARAGRVSPLAPGANLIHAKAVVPVLRRRLEPGVHLLRCAVGAGRRAEDLAGGPPTEDGSLQRVLNSRNPPEGAQG